MNGGMMDDDPTLFGCRWRMNSGVLKLISRGFVEVMSSKDPPEMSFVA